MSDTDIVKYISLATVSVLFDVYNIIIIEIHINIFIVEMRKMLLACLMA